MAKRILILSLFAYCINFLPIHATVCADQFFVEKHVVLGVCKNHARGLSQAEVYYKGVAKVLNDYIKLRIERGDLKNKRFDIYMLDPVLTRPHYEMVQNSTTYFIRSGQDLSLKELMSLIDEFTQIGFTAIDIGVWGTNEKEYDAQTRQIERFEKRIFNKNLPQADIDTVLNNEYIIFEKNKLKMIYKNDIVQTFIDGESITIDMTGWPNVIRDRYIFQGLGFFKIYQDTTLIKTFKFQVKDWYDCEYMDARVFSKWINYSMCGIPLYSYSYDRNRFIDISENNNDTN